MRRRKSPKSETISSDTTSTECLSFLHSPTFLLLLGLCLGARLIFPSLAQEVDMDCRINRPKTAKGNYTPPDIIRRNFAMIKQNCERFNHDREVRAASAKNPGYLKNIIPVVKLGVQLATDGQYAMGQMLPALDLAIDRVMLMPAYRGVFFRIVPILYFDWLACDSLAVLEKFSRKEVNVMFGPINDFVLGAAARFSTALYRIPIISPAAASVNLADKNEYGMLTRIYYTYSDLIWVLDATFRQFKWRSSLDTPIAMITVSPITISDQYNAGWDSYFQEQALERFMENFKKYRFTTNDVNDSRRFYRDLSKIARVVILCADPVSVRGLMLIAQELGFINGEYVFINIDLLSNVEQQARPWYRPNASVEENNRAREAYRVLLTITLRKPDSEEYHKFAQEVQRRAVNDYNYSYATNGINPFIGAFYDSVLLYALALKDTIDSGSSIFNGTMLTNFMRDRTFQGIAGNVSVDSKGDRNTDYSLLDMNPVTGAYEVVGHYSGNAKTYTPLPSKIIDWANEENVPPPDTPPCGFDGTLCHQYNILRISVGMAVTVLILLMGILGGGIFLYRRARFNAELRAMNWIIPWEALDPENNRSRHHRAKKLGYVNQKSAAVNRGNDVDVAAITSVAAVTANTATFPTPITTSPGGGCEKPVVFGVDTPTATSPERQFLLSPKVDLDPNFEKNGENIPISQLLQPQISRVTFGSSPTQMEPRQKNSSKSSYRSLFKISAGDNYSLSTPQAMDDSWVVATGGGSSGGRVSSWWRRQQRWSRKGELPSQEDSNSGDSGTGVGGSSSGWMNWLEVAGAAVGQKKSPQESQQLPALSERRRLRKSSSKRSSSNSKPRKKKSSFVWDSGFMNNKSIRQSESLDSQNSMSSLNTISDVQFDLKLDGQVFSTTTVYKGNVVALKSLPYHRVDLTKELLKEVNRVKDLNYDHICHFVGACIEPQHLCLVYEYCPKGSLRDVLEDEQIKLDWMFKFSLMQDICRGMIYLHHNYGPHGKLKSPNCMVDSRFSLKITDFGLRHLRGPPPPPGNGKTYFINQLWSAPELLRKYPDHGELLGTLKGDVYSFAIICQEIIYRKGVFYRPDISDPVEIVERVKSSPPFRPLLEVSSEEGQVCNADLVTLVQSAWSEEPSLRPEFTTIKMSIRKFNESGDKDNLLDNLLSRMEQYANNLEDLVAERTEQYLSEKKRVEDLLYSILPKSVASQLIRKQAVEAEDFESVTIYFSDIVEFTSLSADSTAIQVVDLLNQLYTLFDSIIVQFDVYKVETIGDAYMVASGLPQRNENKHAKEIARMAIEFLKSMSTFKIPHRPNRELKLRIGIHSGPVCAGVVGVKMPRYCLFGDTVNTSSRMESNGEPKRIHISRATMLILRTFGNFIMSRRGLVEMKGKGKMETYWLHGEYGNIVYPPAPGAVIVDNDPIIVNETSPPLNPPQAPLISCHGGNSSCADPTHTATIAAGAATVANNVSESDQQLINTDNNASPSPPSLTATAKSTPLSQTGTPTNNSLIRAT